MSDAFSKVEVIARHFPIWWSRCATRRREPSNKNRSVAWAEAAC